MGVFPAFSFRIISSPAPRELILDFNSHFAPIE
jgi:hypothetical protein